ncbi:MAG: PspC domain-containing protein [Chitinophagaceae bacterium]|nr:PspC domain-containing protein [Chitinophagaceae bacterium]
MNKVININFQGRVIPIEEPAFEELKQYIESLRNHFANEEGKEEIINDIENRIAELFTEKLKAGQSTFISEEHVAAIIASIGRPEQFDDVTIEENYTSTSSTSSTTSTSSTPSTASVEPRGSLYRNSNEKILGGVCSGLGAYLRIDTTIVRVLFAMLAVGSFGFGLVFYIVLWAILPERFMNHTAVTRKLYRDADQKVFGGVASGIAQYFDIAVWIPRLIFALPFIMGAFESLFHWVHFRGAFTLPFGTWFLIYLILWIVVPKAITASEKLEMKGKKVDLESIKNKVQDEMQGVKKNFTDNASKWKQDFSTKATEFGQEAKETASRFAGEAGPAIRRSGGGFGRFVVGVLKFIVFFVLGVIAIAMVAGLVALFAGFNMLLPLKDFAVNSSQIQTYAWATLILFIAVPIIALVQWLVRRIAGSKVKSPYIALTFGVLWVLGWVSLVMLAATISKEFKRPGQLISSVGIVQPSSSKLKVEFKDAEGQYYPLDLDWDDNDEQDRYRSSDVMLSANEDSVLLRNIRVKLEKSRDDSFHVTLIKRARSSSPRSAEIIAEQISYAVEQYDSVLSLPIAFPITTKNKFHNQQVIVKIEVPVGKEIYVDGKANNLNWYSVRGGANGLSINIDDDYDEDNIWTSGVWYIMRDGGIEKKYKDEESTDKGELMDKIQRMKEEIEKENNKIEEMEMNIKNGDTTVNVKINTTAMADGEQDPATGSSSNPRRLFFGALNLLKMGF